MGGMGSAGIAAGGSKEMLWAFRWVRRAVVEPVVVVVGEVVVEVSLCGCLVRLSLLLLDDDGAEMPLPDSLAFVAPRLYMYVCMNECMNECMNV